jgi:hypothetical protein
MIPVAAVPGFVVHLVHQPYSSVVLSDFKLFLVILRWFSGEVF